VTIGLVLVMAMINPLTRACAFEVNGSTN